MAFWGEGCIIYSDGIGRTIELSVDNLPGGIALDEEWIAIKCHTIFHAVAAEVEFVSAKSAVDEGTGNLDLWCAGMS